MSGSPTGEGERQSVAQVDRQIAGGRRRAAPELGTLSSRRGLEVPRLWMVGIRHKLLIIECLVTIAPFSTLGLHATC